MWCATGIHSLQTKKLGFITSHKQAYVRTHLEQTTLNLAMAHLLISQGSEHCALWTAADPERVRLLLNFHNVTDYKAIRFSDKSAGDVVHAIQDFCSLFQCGPEDLCFYDDDPDVIQRLLDYGVPSWRHKMVGVLYQFCIHHLVSQMYLIR